jgi:hypothetical protein
MVKACINQVGGGARAGVGFGGLRGEVVGLGGEEGVGWRRGRGTGAVDGRRLWTTLPAADPAPAADPPLLPPLQDLSWSKPAKKWEGEQRAAGPVQEAACRRPA